jgi:hypothetical protein
MSYWKTDLEETFFVDFSFIFSDVLILRPSSMDISFQNNSSLHLFPILLFLPHIFVYCIFPHYLPRPVILRVFLSQTFIPFLKFPKAISRLAGEEFLG